MLPALAERLALGRVHNSQLSNLRNRKLASPGPELFVALGRINQVLAAQPAAGVGGAGSGAIGAPKGWGMHKPAAQGLMEVVVVTSRV